MKNTTLAINEAPPCPVAFSFEAGGEYAKLRKEDFETILTERRTSSLSAKLWMAMAIVSLLMLGFSTYWFTTHPQIQVVMAAPRAAK